MNYCRKKKHIRPLEKIIIII
jgi:hypothetical protein